MTIFECTNCGAQYPKWEGRCRECGKWSTITKTDVTNKKSDTKTTKQVPPAEIISFGQIDTKQLSRIKTNITEFDRVLGGGIVPGSLVLIGGAPGIGKSTLLLQIISAINASPLLYISGEESAGQIKNRFDRLKLKSNNLQFSNETNTEKICSVIQKTKPRLTIVDSIQTLQSNNVNSAQGSQAQVTIASAKLMEVAKKSNSPIFLTGHITKQGIVAGPKTLEHLVDTVLYLEGDKNHLYRLLRSAKNRFGSVDEVGIFEMTDTGMQEVKNPSQAFLQGFNTKAPGTVITAIIEGTRTLMVEIQALTTRTSFGYPKRACSGFKKSRLEVLIAILSKRLNMNLGQYDVYLNVAAGLKIKEPSTDLAATLAILSSFRNKPINSKTCVFGEVGLAGEVRPVSFLNKRLREAQNMGFKHVICPTMPQNKSMDINTKQIKNIVDVSAIFDS